MRKVFKRVKAIIVILFLLVFIPTLLIHARFTGFEGGRIVIDDGRLVAVADTGYRFVGWESGEEDSSIPLFSGDSIMSVPLFEPERTDLPTVFITTEGEAPVTTKENYVNCTVSIIGADGGVENQSARIKLRGNSTLAQDKKPYKLKFDEKVDLFCEGKAKEWTLLANHMDYSLSRNYLVYSVAEVLDNLKYTTSVHFVDVYLNGRYDGVYTLCEQVETGKNRVDIPDDLDVTDTGYLVEMDARATVEGVENRDWFSIDFGQPYAIKSPDTEDEQFTSAHVEFIKNYMSLAREALVSGEWSRVLEYLDVKSFVDGYIIDELFKPCDIGFSSFYMYKDAGGKLCRGPIWDYDLSSGNSQPPASNDTSAFYTAAVNVWYAELLKYDQFRTMIGTRLHQVGDDIEARLDSCFEEIYSIKSCLERNFERWAILGTFTMEWNSADACAIDNYDGQLSFLRNWMTDSYATLMAEYSREISLADRLQEIMNSHRPPFKLRIPRGQIKLQNNSDS